MNDRRDEFLVEMYKQMFNDIDRHLLATWQSAGVVVSAFAIFALVEKEIIPVDIATSITLLLCGWHYAHLVDSGYWYNRNLVIIVNIERQFLRRSDLVDIHHYFESHRATNKLIGHLRIQRALGAGLGMLVLLYHFLTRVIPGLTAPLTNFEPVRALPYAVAAASTIYGAIFNSNRNRLYEDFLTKSPGVKVRD